MESVKSISKTELLVNTVQKLSLARNIGEITDIVRKVARRITGADGATFVLRDGSLCYYADEDAISPLWKGSRFPMEKCISGWVMMNKKHVIIDDIYADDRIPKNAYSPTFVKSLAMVPIRKLDPIGAIGNYWASYHNASDEEISLLQSLADITAVSIENIEIRNNLEDKLNERTQMLGQLKKQKTQLEEFTHIIAHNMRAPLSNLLLLADMIKESENTSEKLLFIDQQQPVLNHIHETFEELIEAIHIKNDFSAVREYVEFEQCFNKAKDLLQAEIKMSDAVITSDFSQSDTAYFPEKYLNSVVFNLLSNSIKYRSPERKLEIHVTSYKRDGWTYLEISDNGLGIDLEKNKDKIFMLRKTFHQHPDARGFGLFITKTQIEAMDGTIEVKSNPGMGSTFTIKLFKNIST